MSRKAFVRCLGTMLLCLALPAAPAAAQADFMVTFNANAASAIGIAGTTAVNSAIRNSAETATGAGTAASTPGVATQPASPASLSYQASPQVALEVERDFIAGLSRAAPAQADEIARLFARTDLVAAFDREMQAYGLSSGNLGDAFTAYWAAMWAVANAEPFPDKARIGAIRAQLAPALLGNREVAQAGDAARQRLAEAMIHEAAFALAAHDNAMNGRAPFTPQQLADHAARNLRQKGMDFRTMKLTGAGFAPR